jgi:hypothetical protein
MRALLALIAAALVVVLAGCTESSGTPATKSDQPADGG